MKSVALIFANACLFVLFDVSAAAVMEDKYKAEIAQTKADYERQIIGYLIEMPLEALGEVRVIQ